MGLIWFLLFGLIVGFIARALMPGRQSMSIVLTLLLGCAGSLLGGFVANMLGGHGVTMPTAAGFIGSLLGAFAILGIVMAVSKRRHTTTTV